MRATSRRGELMGYSKELWLTRRLDIYYCNPTTRTWGVYLWSCCGCIWICAGCLKLNIKYKNHLGEGETE